MTNNCQVWITDDDKSMRWVIEKALNKSAIMTRSFAYRPGTSECSAK